MTFDTFFLSFLTATLFGGCTLVISLQNPIHSILVLIVVFIVGSLLLFLLNVEYFAILFLIVYVGAIVVLFLFIVMMLDLKIISFLQRFRDLFSFRYIVILFLMIEILMTLLMENAMLLSSYYQLSETKILFAESNLLTNYSEIIQEIDQLRGIGGVLFSEYKLGIILAALLLFISMIASILLTMEVKGKGTIKEQLANEQALHQSTNISLK
jgi:NADH-quinone oxidoreductase subunit J